MKNLMTPNITLAIVLLAAVAAAALRAAARRPEPRWAPGGEPAPAAGRTPGSLGRPASAVEQMQDIFHELHAEGRNAACPVCDSQYRPTLCPQRKPNSLRQAAAGAADTSGELEAAGQTEAAADDLLLNLGGAVEDDWQHPVRRAAYRRSCPSPRRPR
jgi:hypothetical protein